MLADGVRVVRGSNSVNFIVDNNSKLYEINEAASFILSSLENDDIERTAQNFSQTYGVSVEDGQHAVRKLTAELSEAGLWS